MTCYTTGLVVDMSLGSYEVAAIANNKTASGSAVFLLSCFTITLLVMVTVYENCQCHLMNMYLHM